MGQGAIDAGRGGCAVFSLLGLLASVGIVVWLTSMSTDGSPGRTAPTTGTRTGASAPAVTVPAADVQVTPSSALLDGARLEVSSDDFAAGEDVTISLCLAGAGLVVGPDSCDPATAVTATVDGGAHLETEYPVRRVVSVRDVPFDCATRPRFCVVRVAGRGERPASGSVGLTFDPSVGPPQITLPG